VPEFSSLWLVRVFVMVFFLRWATVLSSSVVVLFFNGLLCDLFKSSWAICRSYTLPDPCCAVYISLVAIRPLSALYIYDSLCLLRSPKSIWILAAQFAFFGVPATKCSCGGGRFRVHELYHRVQRSRAVSSGSVFTSCIITLSKNREFILFSSVNASTMPSFRGSD